MGWDPYFAYLANVVLDLAAELCVLLIGRRLVGRRAALVAQALFGAHVLWTRSLMTESHLGHRARVGAGVDRG